MPFLLECHFWLIDQMCQMCQMQHEINRFGLSFDWNVIMQMGSMMAANMYFLYFERILIEIIKSFCSGISSALEL